jgi:hypothetical protein
MAFDLSIEPKFPPREPRKSVRLTTTLLLPDDREIVAVLTNISRSGFTAKSDVQLELELPLGVAIPGSGIRRALVRWCDKNEFGAKFKERLTDAQLLAI